MRKNLTILLATVLFISCSENEKARLDLNELIEKEFKTNPRWEEFNYPVLYARTPRSKTPQIDKGQFLPCSYWEGRRDVYGKKLRGSCDSELSLQTGNIMFSIDKKYKLNFDKDKLFVFNSSYSSTGKGIGGMVTSDDDTFACNSCDDYMKFNFFIQKDSLIYISVFHRTHSYDSYFKMGNFDESELIFTRIIENIVESEKEQSKESFFERLLSFLNLD